VEQISFWLVLVQCRCRNSSVGIATGYGLDGPNSIAGYARFSLFHNLQTGSGAHPASYPMGCGGGLFSPGLKRSRREADHSPPSMAKVKNGGAIPPLPHMFSWSNA
jgi:hypothetical protein